MTTINDLKNYLQKIQDFLEENYSGDEKLNKVYNTYWASSPYIATGNGFISLYKPTGTENEEDY